MNMVCVTISDELACNPSCIVCMPILKLLPKIDTTPDLGSFFPQECKINGQPLSLSIGYCNHEFRQRGTVFQDCKVISHGIVFPLLAVIAVT